MNFLLHRHLAHAALGSAAAGIGAMLPDLWRMADRRVRTAPVDVAWSALPEASREDATTREVMRGIEHHLGADLWFHDHEVFRAGERATAAALKSAGTQAKKLGLFAHPLWEMCLDGALVRRLGEVAVREEVASGFAGCARAATVASEAHHFAHAEDGDAYRGEMASRMDWLVRELSSGPWIGGYARADGLVRGLEGMRRRFALAPFADEERARLATSIATLAEQADAALGEILAREGVAG
ncbi:MAG: hypothetical protein R3F14_44500 [Polyangiaceae bacterium]